MLKKQHCKTSLLPLVLGLYVIFLFLIYADAAAAQNTDIKLIGKVDRTQVPLNRTLAFRVILSWAGEPDDFTLITVDEPTLTNLKITGTSAAHRSEASAGITRIYNEYSFILAPKELGMGYVESIRAKVKNNIIDHELTLVTNRIPVEVTEPEKESGAGKSNLIWYVLPLLILIIVMGWFTIWRIKAARKKSSAQEPARIMEEQYMQELKSEFDLNQPDLKRDFSRLSRLLRRYLTEKYALAAMNSTAEELSGELDAVELESNQIVVLKEILSRSEEITFSGIAGTIEEMNRFYTQVEGLFLAGLRNKINHTEKEAQ